MSDKQTKTLYHGELRSLSPVEVKVTSDVLASTKKKGEYYVRLEVEGRERYLHPENPGCIEFFKGRKGQTVTIVADGTREEATIVEAGTGSDAAESAPPPPPVHSPPPKQQAPVQQHAPQSHGQQATADGVRHAEEQLALVQAKRFIGRNLSLVKIAVKAAESLRAEYEEATKNNMDESTFNLVISSCLFGASHQSIPDKLPLNIDYSTLQPKAHK